MSATTPSSLTAALVQRSRGAGPATSRGVGHIAVTPAPPLDGICIGSDSFAFTAVVDSNKERVTVANMGVPFEALLPYAICIGFFGISGAGLSKIRHMQNGGKRPRHSVDQWDRQMMDRDRRLTGFLRGQTDNVQAPAGFELSNPWRIEKHVT